MSVAAPEQASVAVPPGKSNSLRRVLQPIAVSVWAIGSLFLSAGTIRWTRGWIGVAMWMLAMPAVGLVTQRYNPRLMEERARWRRKDTKPFDKIFLAVYVPLVTIQPAVGGLDAVRFRWSSLPFAWVYAGVTLYVLAMGLIAWVLCINPYAETSVRIQNDRGQTVVTSGPYRIVRHPMYVGAILMYLAQPLIWGSVWAMVLGAVVGLLMIVRTVFEDRTLRRELPGYQEYAAQTRYRLLPGFW